MLMEFGLAHAKHVTCGLELRHIRRFIRRVGNRDKNVDDGFRGEIGNRCRPDVFDELRARAQDAANVSRFGGESRRPLGVVIDDDDAAGCRAYFRMVPVTPSCEQLNGSIFRSDGANSIVARGNGCVKNSGSA